MISKVLVVFLLLSLGNGQDFDYFDDLDDKTTTTTTKQPILTTTAQPIPTTTAQPIPTTTAQPIPTTTSSTSEQMTSEITTTTIQSTSTTDISINSRMLAILTRLENKFDNWLKKNTTIITQTQTNTTTTMNTTTILPETLPTNLRFLEEDVFEDEFFLPKEDKQEPSEPNQTPIEVSIIWVNWEMIAVYIVSGAVVTSFVVGFLSWFYCCSCCKVKPIENKDDIEMTDEMREKDKETLEQ